MSGASAETAASGVHAAVDGDLATLSVDTKTATITASVEGTVDWKGDSTRPGGNREEKSTDQAKGSIELKLEQ